MPDSGTKSLIFGIFAVRSLPALHKIGVFLSFYKIPYEERLKLLAINTTVRTAFYVYQNRMYQRGYIYNDNGRFYLTEQGERLVSQAIHNYKKIKPQIDKVLNP